VLWVGLRQTECAHVVKRLHDAVESSPVTWNGVTLHVAFSSGVAWLERFREMSDLDKLVEQADRGLREAKKRGTPTVRRGKRAAPDKDDQSANQRLRRPESCGNATRVTIGEQADRE